MPDHTPADKPDLPLKFQSGNGIEVERATMTRQEILDFAVVIRRKVLEEAAELCDAKFNKMAAGGFPREASASRALAKEIRSLLDRKETTT